MFLTKKKNERVISIFRYFVSYPMNLVWNISDYISYLFIFSGINYNKSYVKTDCFGILHGH